MDSDMLEDFIVELKSKEAFNFALFQHNPAPMVILDAKGLVVKSNLALRGLPIPVPALNSPLFNPDESEAFFLLYNSLAEVLETGVAKVSAEVNLYERFFNITIAPLPSGVLVTYDDITTRKKEQEQAERKDRQLIQADKMIALGTMVAGVAHEISNPGNAMSLSGALLEASWSSVDRILSAVKKGESPDPDVLGKLDEIRSEVPELIDIINRSCNRITALVDELKDFSSTESVVVRKHIDINEIVKSAASLMKSVLKKSCQNFSLDLDEELPDVYVCVQRIEQVLVNLISNACNALSSSDGSILIRTFLSVQGMVVVNVEDSGAGMAPEILQRIKDPFFTTRHDNGGTGLGLAISDKIIRNAGGTLSFQSDPGNGSVAVIELPVSGQEICV